VTRPRTVDDPRFDQTPGVGDHQPILMNLLTDIVCVFGDCEHQGPPHCPTVPKKVCAECTSQEGVLHADVQTLTAGAMRWPCPAAMTGGAR
jgi:hypothetical protein